MNTHPCYRWDKLARHSSAIVALTEQPDVSLLSDDDDVITRWCNAIAGLKAALAEINAAANSPAPNWRSDLTRTRYRDDYDTRAQVHIIRNRRRHGRISHNNAAAVLEEIGFAQDAILRLLGEFMEPDDTPPEYKWVFSDLPQNHGQVPPKAPPPPPSRDVRGKPSPSFVDYLLRHITGACKGQ